MNDSRRVRSSRRQRANRRSPDRWAAAIKHLAAVDPHLKAIIDRVGPCGLEPHPDRFACSGSFDHQPADFDEGRPVDQHETDRARR